MGLSFELGVPLHELRGMSQRDLHQYQAYVYRHGLPSARTERMLAQLALVVGQVQGIKGLRLADFLAILQPPPDDDEQQQPFDPEQAAEAAAAALGFNPRRRASTPQPQN